MQSVVRLMGNRKGEPVHIDALYQTYSTSEVSPPPSCDATACALYPTADIFVYHLVHSRPSFTAMRLECRWHSLVLAERLVRHRLFLPRQILSCFCCDAHTLPQTVMSLAARGRARSVDSFRTTIVEKGYFSLCLCRLDSERPSHMYPVDHDQQPTPTLSDAFIPQIPNHSESQDFRKRMPRHNKQLKQ